MLMLMLALACRSDDPADADSSTVTPPPQCGATRFAWDPDGDEGGFVAFPDDRYTVDAPEVASGLRVSVSDASWLAELSPLAQSMLVQADDAPGFARMGQVVLAFEGDLGSVPDPDALRWVDLDSGVAHPFEARLASGGDVLVLEPLRPLEPAHRYAVALSVGHLAADDGCVTVSDALFGALAGRRADRLGDRLASVPDAVGLPAGQIAAAVVFTSADGGAPMAAAAEDVHEQSWGWATPLACTTVGDTLRCEGELAGADYRAFGASGAGAVGAVKGASWSLPVSLRAPVGADNVPLIIYGHGMEGSRAEIDFLWQFVEDLDVAVVAMDALYHGDHPTGGAALAVLPFLGIDLLALTLNTSQTRGSFDQTALERLQLIEALSADPQIPGGPTLDMSRVGYHGSSLGGLLGAGVLAHSEVDAGFLTVAGGNLIRLAVAMDAGEGTTMGDLLKIIVGGDDEVWEVFMAVAQVALDAADPAVHAAHPRVAEAHVFLPVAQQDEIVAKVAGQALARSLALPHVEPVEEFVATLTPVAPPLSGNEGGMTRGFFQHAEVTSGGVLVPATHVTTMNSPEVATQVRAWWEAWVNTGVPVIVAP